MRRGRQQTKQFRKKPTPLDELPALEEITLLNSNIRGINGREKQESALQLIKAVKPTVVCFNETKLQYDLFLDNYWAHQTKFERRGGCWTAV